MAIDVASAFIHPDVGHAVLPTRAERVYSAKSAAAAPSDRPTSNGHDDTKAAKSLPGIVIDQDGVSEKPDDRRLMGEFVGSTFYGILFRQLRQSEFKGKYMHGGRGEEVFQAQLDQELAKRIGESPNDPITNKVYEAYRQRIPDGSREKSLAESKSKSSGGVTMAYPSGDGRGKLTMTPRGIEMYQAEIASMSIAAAASPSGRDSTTQPVALELEVTP